MTRTCLTGLALIGLLACGGSKATPPARNAGTGSRQAAQPASGTTKSQQRTTRAQRDTAKHVNPLTGH